MNLENELTYKINIFKLDKYQMIDFTQQTDKIVMLDKWTQRPPVASIHSAVEDFDLFMQNVRGCGGQVKNLSSL
jgi:hypothetical protein